MSLIVRRNGGRRGLIPFNHRVSVLDEMDRFASEMWDTWRPLPFAESRVPQTDVYEEKDKLVVKTELPGISKDDLDISLEKGRLTIKAEKKDEVKEDTTHHTRERYYGQYFRSMDLPYPVEEDKISATFDNGVLEIDLPKAEEVKAKKIEIKAQLPEDETKKKTKKST